MNETMKTRFKSWKKYKPVKENFRPFFYFSWYHFRHPENGSIWGKFDLVLIPG